MKSNYLLLALILFTVNIFAQPAEKYLALTIDPEVQAASNAVVRYEKIEVEIKDRGEIVLKKRRIVTVLNKKGNKHVRAYEFYSNDQEILNLNAKIYDGLGEDIKKIKERDFKDESAVSRISIYEDDRVKYLEYIPLDYPYTVDFTSEVTYQNTAGFPTWQPLDQYYQSIEHSEFKILNPNGLELRFKEENFENKTIEKISDFHYIAKDLPALEYEAYAPDFDLLVPRLRIALTNFSMIGVDGENNNWQDFGKWMHDRLLQGTSTIPEATKQDILALTSNVEDEIERAKIVYQYMQDRTRYISIQIGIGGWRPMLATDVDELGYGDCKGLSNYTKALMEIAGVTTYYTVIYGGSDIVDLDRDFSSLQGNHAILALPNEDNYIFLECTSQTVPFGFVAGFTDDRDALIVTPEGGKIVHTTIYGSADSYTHNSAKIILDEKGNIQSNLELNSGGYLYNLRQPVETKNHRDQILDYKEEWGYLNEMDVNNILITNDKDSVVFKEQLSISANSYASKSGDRLLFQPNVFNRRNYIPPRYSERQSSFEIPRSYEEVDEYEIEFPNNLLVEAVSDGVEIDTQFGSYSFSIEVVDDKTIKYKRILKTKKGTFPKEDYKAYRSFRKRIVKSDKAKVVFKNNRT